MKVYVLTLLTFFCFSALAQEAPSVRERLSLEVVQGMVTEIDAETREVTLVDVEGNLVTITASEEIQRFDEIAVNDVISLEYWNYLMAEFRQPTQDELATPLAILPVAAIANDDIPPGAMLGEVIKAVVTVEIINRPSMSVTVQGPRGNYVAIDVEDPGVLTELTIGQQVILTYAEAMAVSLIKN